MLNLRIVGFALVVAVVTPYGIRAAEPAQPAVASDAAQHDDMAGCPGKVIMTACRSPADDENAR